MHAMHTDSCGFESVLDSLVGSAPAAAAPSQCSASAARLRRIVRTSVVSSHCTGRAAWWKIHQLHWEKGRQRRWLPEPTCRDLDAHLTPGQSWLCMLSGRHSPVSTGSGAAADLRCEKSALMRRLPPSLAPPCSAIGGRPVARCAGAAGASVADGLRRPSGAASHCGRYARCDGAACSRTWCTFSTWSGILTCRSQHVS